MQLALTSGMLQHEAVALGACRQQHAALPHSHTDVHCVHLGSNLR